MGDNQLDRGGEMSAPDARLSAAERAALADLEAAAAASDPHLAARLKGGPPARLRIPLPSFAPGLLRVWKSFLGIGWWAAAVTLIGLALTVLGLSAGLGLSVLGALVAAAGLRALAEAVERRRSAPGRSDSRS